jgi:hypothetical protein
VFKDIIRDMNDKELVQSVVAVILGLQKAKDILKNTYVIQESVGQAVLPRRRSDGGGRNCAWPRDRVRIQG